MHQCFVAWELQPLLHDMEIALSELVTNAVRHARTPLEVALSSESAMVEVAVRDGHPAIPTPRPQRADLDADLAEILVAEKNLGTALADVNAGLDVGEAGSVTGGRGLLLVQALAAQWGTSPLSDGKAVWIRTPAPAGWPHASGCPCATSADAITLASGRRALHRG